MSYNNSNKTIILLLGLILTFFILIGTLIRLQIIEKKYKINADNNALFYKTKYPVRGLILDRNEKILVGNKIVYDILVTPYDIHQFDTIELCKIFNIDTSYIHNYIRYFNKNKRKIGYQSITILKQVPAEQYNKFIEKNHRFPGFYGIARTIRNYPFDAGGNLLGYISEADPEFLKNNTEYQLGDYVGKTGFEKRWEKDLRGEKGYNVFLRNARNIIHSPYENGKYDKQAVPGKNVYSTVDADLQAYGELLMQNKKGSIVAIEPSTGEILSMVSSPGIKIEQLENISKYYDEIITDPNKPMFNRAVMSPQPPGSVFKLVNALIGLQEGTLKTTKKYPCYGGYSVGNLKVGCHIHPTPLDLERAIMMSCNAYFCNVFRKIIDNDKYNTVAESLDSWNKYVKSFGFGEKLGSDFPSEQPGTVPSSNTYNNIHGENRWKSLSIISLAIGQGELGCTPLHLANLASIIANRGFYYIPHIVKNSIKNPIDEKYKVKNYCMIDSINFDPIINGMYLAVNSPGGSGATARLAKVKNLDICGKTGTAENPHGKDHSVFICFAPKDDPKIAVAVYIENAGFGGTWAAPIASLMVEKYFNGEITRNERRWIEAKMKQAKFINSKKETKNEQK